MKSRLYLILYLVLLIAIQLTIPSHCYSFANNPDDRLIIFLMSCEEESQPYYDKYSIEVTETPLKYNKNEGVSICTKDHRDAAGNYTEKHDLFSIRNDLTIDSLNQYRLMAYSINDSSNYRLPTVDELLFCRERLDRILWTDNLNDGFIVAADTSAFTDQDHFYLFDSASGVVFIANLRKIFAFGNNLRVLPFKGVKKDLKRIDRQISIGYNTRRSFPRDLSPNCSISYSGFVDELKLHGKGKYNENLLILPQFSNDDKILIFEPLTTYGFSLLNEYRIRNSSLEDEIIANNLRYPKEAGYSGYADILIDLEEVQIVNHLYKSLATKNKIEIAQKKSALIDSLVTSFYKYYDVFNRFCSNKYCMPMRVITMDLDNYDVDRQILSLGISSPQLDGLISKPNPNDDNWERRSSLCKSINKLEISMSLEQAGKLFENADKVYGYYYFFVVPRMKFNSSNVQEASLTEVQLDIFKDDNKLETDDYWCSYVFKDVRTEPCWVVSGSLKGSKLNKPKL